MPTYTITYHTGEAFPLAASAADLTQTDSSAPQTEECYLASATVIRPAILDDPPDLPFLDAPEEVPGAVPVYETTTPCDEKGAKKRQNVAHMDELKAEEPVFLQILLSLHYHSQLLSACSCGQDSHLRKVACTECLQAELLCPRCWLDKHRTMPTHWALIWNTKDGFFEKHDFCRVMKNASVVLGHYGEQCPDGDMARMFTLDSNRIHATAIKFCWCKTVDRQHGAPEFQQLLRMGIFPGSVKDLKTGYTLGLLEYYRQECNQGKGSAYNFVHVLQRMANPFFAGAVPHIMLDGNFKANLFFKHDDGSDTALTDGNMYFPVQKEFERIAKAYVIPEEDKEVSCKAHIGSIWHQVQGKYGNVAISGVIGSACDHAVLAAFINMLIGEAHLRTTGAFEVNELTAARPSVHLTIGWELRQLVLVRSEQEETWLHKRLAMMEGQIPADHINGHGPDCQCFWQAVYFACRAHFHRETAEMLWAFLNPLGSSTCQMTGAASHNIINYVIDAWNTSKVLRQAQLLAAERSNALRLFELHMAVVEDLSRQHATEVGAWSRLSQLATKSAGGKPQSVYQHESTKVLTIESMLASLVAEEREKLTRAAGSEPTTLVAQWIHNGMDIEHQQVLVIALLNNHRQHPLQETWDAIAKLRDSLNLSALDADEPELTAIQLPSYRMKHGQRTMADGDANDFDSQLREAEIKLRCSEADSGILAVCAASLALSAIRKAGELDYRGQVGVTRSQRNVQKAELMKFFEMAIYTKAQASLIHLGHMLKNATEPYPPLTLRDTRRKETHLHRAKGDSRLFDGTAWYLQSGGTLPGAAVPSPLSPIKRQPDKEAEPQLLSGTQTLKHAGGLVKSPRRRQRLGDFAVQAG
ncbi:hypothetical protein B0H17DRAFT_1126981 [Mycena rosella]|uniref:CxC2-like cysteine cluster KDZ transposase-associated domain-containing protein n=1 Tax=Mycena rosella TaxID=1033263 RepID=A0AAD7GRX0_MYCRO|nr:hypothetical protein B0H17DRAFT_1126981 [Mycena rosella]